MTNSISKQSKARWGYYGAETNHIRLISRSDNSFCQVHFPGFFLFISNSSWQIQQTEEAPTNPYHIPELQNHDPPIELEHPEPPVNEDEDDGYASSVNPTETTSLASSSICAIYPLPSRTDLRYYSRSTGDTLAPEAMLAANMRSALKPGGWIELPEFRWIYGCDDGALRPDFTPPQMVAKIKAGLAKFDIEMHAAEKSPDRLRDVGFVNIGHEIKKVPVRPWSKDPNLKMIRLYNRSVVYDGLQVITIGPFTRELGWTADEVEVFLVQVRKDLMDPSVHPYVHFHSLCAQKPIS
ncbi:hypothetical protein F53441_1200 [Fusarium austroafricanum]|uniref:Methyltransferase n=1 Tax=Fusarium austroafricanum TaxID=2364996 RepID=A0A8H4NZB2_9HYPO|nr:hypothetical protein F53441_1200 [Fusarium austroafricanum]